MSGFCRDTFMINPTMYLYHSVVQEITGRLEYWWSSYNQGNMQAVVSLFADDAVLMPPGNPTVYGKSGELCEHLKTLFFPLIKICHNSSFPKFPKLNLISHLNH